MAKTNKRKIYYGPKGHETAMYWDIPVTRAKKGVSLDGELKQGRQGTNIGCGISALAYAQKKVFPHPAYLISVTATGMIVVDRLNKAGQPAHGIWYAHKYAWFVHANDEKNVKAVLDENPDAMKGPFDFTPPRKYSGTGGKGKHPGERGTGKRSVFVPRGCLGRAKRAGFIDPVAMKQMTQALG